MWPLVKYHTFHSIIVDVVPLKYSMFNVQRILGWGYNRIDLALMCNTLFTEPTNDKEGQNYAQG